MAENTAPGGDVSDLLVNVTMSLADLAELVEHLREARSVMAAEPEIAADVRAKYGQVITEIRGGIEDAINGDGFEKAVLESLG